VSDFVINPYVYAATGPSGFPVVEATAESSTSTAGTSHTITMPAGTQASDMVLLVVGTGNAAASFDALTDWSEILDEGTSGGLKILTYTGSGAPSNPTFTSSTNVRTATIAFRISGADKTTTPEIAVTPGSATNNSPDPPALTPSVPGGALDYLWIAVGTYQGEAVDDDSWCNSPPTNYDPSTPLQKACGTLGTFLGGIVYAAYRQLNASSENPGTFNTDLNFTWRTQTICVYPD
jgi:hypothetical protein